MYTSTTRWELVRAAGLVITITFGIALFFVGGQLFAWTDPAWPIVDLAILAVGVAVLITSGRRINQLRTANKPYLLSEEGRLAIRGRRELEKRILTIGRVTLAVFIVCAIVFFFLFSAIACGSRIDGYCGQVGRPAEWIVQTWQLVSVAIGATWAALVSFRRRHEAETERIDLVVAEGLRRRRAEDPMLGTDRFSWE